MNNKNKHPFLKFLGFLITCVIVDVIFMSAASLKDKKIRIVVKNPNQKVTKTIVDKATPAPDKPNKNNKNGSASKKHKQTSVKSKKDGRYFSEDGMSIFDKRQAYVRITAKNQTVIDASKKAVADWNKTGAFKFILTSDKKSDEITISDTKKKMPEQLGVTQQTYRTDNGACQGASIVMNIPNLKTVEPDLRCHSVEHELGHAIGLGHSKAKDSIMQAVYQDRMRITESDIEKVNKFYEGVK